MALFFLFEQLLFSEVDFSLLLVKAVKVLLYSTTDIFLSKYYALFFLGTSNTSESPKSEGIFIINLKIDAIFLQSCCKICDKHIFL